MSTSDAAHRRTYALHGKIMLCSVVVLAAAIFAAVCFHSHYSRRRRTRRRPSDHLSSFAAVDGNGLDRAVLKSLPSFAYSAAAHRPLLKCAVCLSAFRNDETGRVLPKCDHAFHVSCIDTWFQSHANCPLCRAPVQAGIPVHAIVLVHEPAEMEAVSGS